MAEGKFARREASAFARHVGGRIAGELFTSNRGEKGCRLVIEQADGREVVSWSEHAIARFIALVIDGASKLPAREAARPSTASPAGRPPRSGTSR